MANVQIIVVDHLNLIKHEERLDSLYIDKYRQIMRDLKKEFLRGEEFDLWWNRTSTSDDRKELVRRNLNIIG